MPGKVLVVDDEAAIRDMVALALEQSDFICLKAADAAEAQRLLATEVPDLVLLDWMLPGISGVDLARRLRRDKRTAQLPIIMLTARAGEQDKVQGLETGADDYLTKPFSTRELIARIRALLRRSAPGARLSCLGLELDAEGHRAYADGEALNLGPTEFRLLAFFMSNPERVHTRGRMLDAVWGENIYIDERTVDVHIRRLRKALEPSGHDRLIQTVRGAGYRFSDRS